MSIPEMREWLELNKRNLTLGLLFVLTSVISFGLGYLYAGESAHPLAAPDRSAASSTLKTVAPSSTKKIVKLAKPAAPPAKKVAPPVTIVYEPPTSSVSMPADTRASPGASQGEPQPATGLAPSPETTPAPSINSAAIEPVRITEVSPGSEASSDDEFIELFNPNAVPVDLTGYSIKKRSGGGGESALVSAARLQGKSIPAEKHFLIAHDQGYAGSVAPDATWAKSNGLAYTNNAVILYNASGAKVTEVSWTEIEKGRSSSGVPSPQNSSN